jgi:hypothetical protein
MEGGVVTQRKLLGAEGSSGFFSWLVGDHLLVAAAN